MKIQAHKGTGTYLVRVRAQVMTRDGSPGGGWVPMGNGGFSNVSIRKRLRPPSTTKSPVCGATADSSMASKPKHDYFIYAKRVNDSSVIMSCPIKKDFEYKVTSTFHHWKTDDKRYGLNFQNAADARAFDKGVRTAVEDLLNGCVDTSPLTTNIEPKGEVGDDEVFMTLDLPQDPKDSRSSSESSSTKGSEHIPKIAYIGRDKLVEHRQPTSDPLKVHFADIPLIETGAVESETENYPYVQLTAVHEYIYPAEEVPPTKASTLVRRDSASNMKVCGVAATEASSVHQPLKTQKKVQSMCRYCHELYNVDNNPKGSCNYSPDIVRSTIDRIACIGCAECIGYHCASDAEGDFPQHPCDCTNDENCTRRWVCLTVLSIFVPCLWLYPPLKLCHFCCVKCGICGGRHSM